VRACVLAAWLVASVLVAPRAWAQDPVRMVILPVVVHRDSSDSSYVSRGIAEMLSARLEQIGGIEVLRLEGEGAATTDLAAAREAARRIEGDYVLYGSFTQFGDGASLDMQCAALSANNGNGEAVRRVFIQSGTVGEIIPKLDRLVDKIAKFLREGGAIESADPRVAAKEPSTPGADGAEGGEAIRALQKRIEALEQAVYRAPVPEDASAATLQDKGLPES